MDKRIGNFTNPETGERDWVEPDTVERILIDPDTVLKVGEVRPTPVDYRFKALHDIDKFGLCAEIRLDGTRYVSSDALMDPEEFASELAFSVYERKNFGETELVKKAKADCLADLTDKLLDAGVLTGGMTFRGLGLVSIEGEKLMTIEELDFQYRVEGNNPIRTVDLKKCVGLVPLTGIRDYSITFYTGKHRVELTSPEIVQSEEGALKSYKLNVGNLTVTLDNTMPEHEEFGETNFETEEELAAFIKSRRSLLDDSEGESDDAFDDFFDMM